ncbi:MAG: hypothetical protein ACN4GK_02525 [Acidimicrobiia bacterium]
MSKVMSMRERVETGWWTLFGYGLVALLSWWWHGHTSAPSFWWSATLLLAIGGLLGIIRGAVLVASGFSGFGRNFHEPRDPIEFPADDESIDQSVALNGETAGPLLFPLVLLISGGIVTLLKVFPAMNFVPEFEGEHWVSPRMLVPWMFFTGAATIAWSILLRVMMRTGADRWTYIPGTRNEIRTTTRNYVVASVVLIAIAAVNV